MPSEFWGMIVKSGEKKKVELDDGGILTVAQAALTNGKNAESTKLFAEVMNEDEGPTSRYLLCTLTTGRVDQHSLDLNFFPITQSVAFAVEGPGEIHLTGYSMIEEYSDSEEDEPDFESMTEEQVQQFLHSRRAQLADDEEEEGSESGEGEEEEESEEGEENGKPPVQKLQAPPAKQTPVKQEKPQEKPQQQPHQGKPAASPKAQAATPSPAKAQPESKKRKAEDTTDGENKQQKTAPNQAATGQFRCETCNKTIKSEQGYKQHMQDKHSTKV